MLWDVMCGASLEVTRLLPGNQADKDLTSG